MNRLTLSSDDDEGFTPTSLLWNRDEKEVNGSYTTTHWLSGAEEKLDSPNEASPSWCRSADSRSRHFGTHSTNSMKQINLRECKDFARRKATIPASRLGGFNAPVRNKFTLFTMF